VQPFLDPITVHEPACGSGGMSLRQAALWPRWAIQHGVVRFDLLDTDATCCQMARMNMALYGLHTTVTHGNVLTMNTMHQWRTSLLQIQPIARKESKEKREI